MRHRRRTRSQRAVPREPCAGHGTTLPGRGPCPRSPPARRRQATVWTVVVAGGSGAALRRGRSSTSSSRRSGSSISPSPSRRACSDGCRARRAGGRRRTGACARRAGVTVVAGGATRSAVGARRARRGARRRRDRRASTTPRARSRAMSSSRASSARSATVRTVPCPGVPVTDTIKRVDATGARRRDAGSRDASSPCRHRRRSAAACCAARHDVRCRGAPTMQRWSRRSADVSWWSTATSATARSRGPRTSSGRARRSWVGAS